MKLALINGPNLNLLGKREPEIYGSQTLVDIEKSLVVIASEQSASLNCFQSNIEGEIVGFIHEAMGKADGILINPGAYTHTSIAIRDAFLSTGIPFVEIHISNIYARESFRHKSYLSDIASGVILGCGIKGYELGLYALINSINTTRTN